MTLIKSILKWIDKEIGIDHIDLGLEPGDLD